MRRSGVVVFDGVSDAGRRPSPPIARTRAAAFTVATRGAGGRRLRSLLLLRVLPPSAILLLSPLVLASLLSTRASVTVVVTATPHPLAPSPSLGGATAAYVVAPSTSTSTWTGRGRRGGGDGVTGSLHRPLLRLRLAPRSPPPRFAASSSSSSSSAAAAAAAGSRIRMTDGDGDGDDGGAEEVPAAAKTGGTARFVGINASAAPSTTTSTATTAGSVVDSVLSALSSDVGNISLGTIGLLACLTNRLLYAPDESAVASGVMGGQSRADLLAAFASMAVLLNGVSRLDVTSALAETVDLDGVGVGAEVTDSGRLWLRRRGRGRSVGGDPRGGDGGGEALLGWALASAIGSTPAETAVLMVRRRRRAGGADGNGEGDGGAWEPGALAGVVPPAALARSRGRSGDDDGAGDASAPAAVAGRTPILDRFLRDPNGRKETYLPTLQALPGRVEFTTTYLPSNAQEALLVPVTLPDGVGEGEASGVVAGGEADEVVAAVLVLASGTAKSFSPRDVARCQVIASRMDGFGPGSRADDED